MPPFVEKAIYNPKNSTKTIVVKISELLKTLFIVFMMQRYNYQSIY